jgi:hypothetical protein
MLSKLSITELIVLKRKPRNTVLGFTFAVEIGLGNQLHWGIS